MTCVRLGLLLILVVALISVSNGQGTGIMGSPPKDMDKQTTEAMSIKAESTTKSPEKSRFRRDTEEGEEEEEEEEEEKPEKKKGKKDKKKKDGDENDEENEQLLGDAEMEGLGSKNCKDNDELDACQTACDGSNACKRQAHDDQCEDDCFKMCRYAEKWQGRKCVNHAMAHIRTYRDLDSGASSPRKGSKDDDGGSSKSGGGGGGGGGKGKKGGGGGGGGKGKRGPSRDASKGGEEQNKGGGGLGGLLGGGQQAPKKLMSNTGQNSNLLG